MKSIMTFYLLAWLFIPALKANAAGLPLNPANFRIFKAVDTETAYVASAEPHWLDNDRILLRVVDRQLSQTKVRDGRPYISEPRYTLHVWNIRSGEIRRHSRDEVVGGICVSDRTVRYTVKRGADLHIREGALGAETERQPTSARIGRGGAHAEAIVNPYTCQEYWYEDIDRPNAGSAFPLRHSDGVLESVGSIGSGRVDPSAFFPPYKRWLHKNGITKEIALPQEQFLGRPLYWSPINAYVYRWTPDRLEKGMPNRFYAIHPEDAEVTSIEIPGSSHWTYLWPATATRAGLLASSSAIDPKRSSDPGTSGLYLFFGRDVQKFYAKKFPELREDQFGLRYERIASGLVDSLAVSPDGCHAVSKMDPYNRGRASFVLLLVGFCEKGGGNVD